MEAEFIKNTCQQTESFLRQMRLDHWDRDLNPPTREERLEWEIGRLKAEKEEWIKKNDDLKKKYDKLIKKLKNIRKIKDSGK